MNNLIYKIRNKIFRLSNESKKLIRPTFKELNKYKNFSKDIDNKFALSFGGGRSGQNWFSKIFNSHPNWIGTCERFADYEAFYRYICYYNLPVSKEGFYNLLTLSSNKDMSEYQNSLIASPYISFGLTELLENLNVDYVFFNIRNPINTVEDFFTKGWYQNSEYLDLDSPLIDFTESQYHSFSRIIPQDDFKDEWKSLTRIGKISWFWSIINNRLYLDFDKIKDKEKFYVKLEDIDKNYNIYENLCTKFLFKNKMTKKKFNKVIYKAGNKGEDIIYRYKDWNKLEKKEFDDITEKFFPNYSKIKTTL